jgi:hypothetical protein
MLLVQIVVLKQIEMRSQVSQNIIMMRDFFFNIHFLFFWFACIPKKLRIDKVFKTL